MHSMPVLDTHIDINHIYIERERYSLFIQKRYIKCVLCKDTCTIRTCNMYIHSVLQPTKNMASNML